MLNRRILKCVTVKCGMRNRRIQSAGWITVKHRIRNRQMPNAKPSILPNTEYEGVEYQLPGMFFCMLDMNTAVLNIGCMPNMKPSNGEYETVK